MVLLRCMETRLMRTGATSVDQHWGALGNVRIPQLQAPHKMLLQLMQQDFESISAVPLKLGC